MEPDRLADIAQLAVVVPTDAVRLDLHGLTVDVDPLAGLLCRERGACRGTRDSRAEQNTAGDQRNLFSSVVLHGIALLLDLSRKVQSENPQNVLLGQAA